MKLQTRFSVAECRSRLEAAADPEKLGFSLSGYAGSRAFIVKIGATSFRLRTRRYYINSFAPFFYGNFISSDGGTTISGDFRMHPMIKPFMVFWFCGLAIFGVTVFVLPSRGQPQAIIVRLLMLLVLGGMAAFGVGLVKFGRWLGSSEEEAMTAFLKKTFETG
jgi:hypothetical protein